MSNRNSRHRDLFDPAPFEKMRHGCRDNRTNKYKHLRTESDRFRCINCSLLVASDHELSGVNNRNHCPNCLWSKHVDLMKAGDRKAACGARMEPIGLTLKRVGKRYGGSGELMIIHRCSGCGKVSINRIAADDSAGALLSLYRRSQELEGDLLCTLLKMDIHPLQAADLTTVYSQLFGWQSILGEFTPPPEAIEIPEETLTAGFPDQEH